jgi:hypothetical protein
MLYVPATICASLAIHMSHRPNDFIYRLSNPWPATISITTSSAGFNRTPDLLFSIHRLCSNMDHQLMNKETVMFNTLRYYHGLIIIGPYRQEEPRTEG